MQIQQKSVQYYDLHEILKVMEQNGHMKEREVWRNYVTEWGIKNDTIFHLGFEYYSSTNKHEEYEEYFKEVNKLLGLPIENKGIMVNVSW